MITRFFVDVACDLSERRAGALFLEFANAAVSWVGQIIPGPAIMDGSRGPQRPTVRTDIDVARSVVSKVEAREHAVSSLVSFLNRNMRGDVLVQEPGEQLARPISGIGRESSRLKAEGRFGSIDHRPGCRNLVIGARWRRLDIDDDSVLDIDHVVEPIAKLDTLVRLRGPAEHGSLGEIAFGSLRLASGSSSS